MQVIKSRQTPTEPEWIMSPLPNKFNVVFNNDTGFITGYDRVAVVAELREKVADSPEPGKSIFMIAIVGLRSLAPGDLPGETLDKVPDAQEFCAKIQSRLTAALDLWADNTSFDERMEVWMTDNDNPLETLASLLGDAQGSVH